MVFCVVNTSIFFFPFYLLCLFFLLLHNGESIGSQFCSFGTDGIGNIGTNLSHSVILRNLLLQQFHFQNRHIYYSNSTIVHSFPKCIYLYSFLRFSPICLIQYLLFIHTNFGIIRYYICLAVFHIFFRTCLFVINNFIILFYN